MSAIRIIMSFLYLIVTPPRIFVYNSVENRGGNYKGLSGTGEIGFFRKNPYREFLEIPYRGTLSLNENFPVCGPCTGRLWVWMKISLGVSLCWGTLCLNEITLCVGSVLRDFVFEWKFSVCGSCTGDFEFERKFPCVWACTGLGEFEFERKSPCVGTLYWGTLGLSEKSYRGTLNFYEKIQIGVWAMYWRLWVFRKKSL